EEVSVPTPGGFTLAGTLTLPREARGPVPAVVLISGSGQQDRDSRIPGIEGYRAFRQIADTLGRRGIAVLRLDDRGSGRSGGKAEGSTSADFADDARAAVAYLRGRGEIAPDRIALAGHSEGGIIAPMVAASDPRIRAVVLMAAQSWTGRRVSDYQLRQAWRAAGVPEARMDSLARVNDRARDSVAAQIPWVRFFLDHDPLPTARRVNAPVLILQGATDRQVTAEQAPELAAAIRAGGNRDVTVRLLPGVNHLFLRDPVGTADPARYAALPSKEVVPEALGALADWLAAKLR
ncbi:MAG TPA: alpha/beta fold hydrolase, partial [Longimicrobiaceae bacterium]